MLAALLNLGFAGGGVYVPPEPEVATTGGGRSKRKGRRYPRRVMLRGVTHVVRSWDEELSLLQAALDRVEYHAAVEQTPELVKAAPVVRRRLKKVESARDKWLSDLRRADEELLIFLL